MKTSIALAAVAVGVFATPAFAQDGSSNYVQVNLGSSVSGEVDLGFDLNGAPPPGVISNEFDLETGVFGSVAAGTGVGGGFSFEGEVFYLDGGIEDADIDGTSYAVLFNGIYSFSAGSFSPYVGAGLGYGFVKYEEDGGFDESDSGLTWQLKAGVTFPMSDTITWDVGYRYIALPEFETTEAGIQTEAEATAHVVSVGARFSF